MHERRNSSIIILSHLIWSHDLLLVLLVKNTQFERPGVSSSMAPAYQADRLQCRAVMSLFDPPYVQALAAGSFGATSSPTKVLES